MQSDSDLGFLKLFLNENIYVIPDNDSEPLENNSDIKYFGQNKSNVSVLVNYQNTDFLKTPEFDFLLKIMEAIKLTLNELAIINIHENDTLNLDLIRASLNPKKIILFDVPLSLLGENDERELYEMFKLENLILLKAENLSYIMTDVQKKRNLWTSLQKMF